MQSPERRDLLRGLNPNLGRDSRAADQQDDDGGNHHADHLLLVAEESGELSPEELADGWISLFDGETLFGWKHENKADWRVEDGAIVVEKGENSLLVTTTQFSDYMLKLQFRCEPTVNSGIFLSTTMVPSDVTTEPYHKQSDHCIGTFSTYLTEERSDAIAGEGADMAQMI